MTSLSNSLNQGDIIEAEGDLRAKNQITIPRVIAEAVGAHPGDRFLFVVHEGERDVFHVHRLRDSYAGVLEGVYGKSQEAFAYIESEREAWEE